MFSFLRKMVSLCSRQIDRLGIYHLYEGVVLLICNVKISTGCYKFQVKYFKSVFLRSKQEYIVNSGTSSQASSKYVKMLFYNADLKRVTEGKKQPWSTKYVTLLFQYIFSFRLPAIFSKMSGVTKKMQKPKNLHFSLANVRVTLIFFVKKNSLVIKTVGTL